MEDLALRSGPPTSNSFTPFNGKADVLREQFSGSQMDRFNMEGFLAENASFEFDPTRTNQLVLWRLKKRNPVISLKIL